MADPFDEEEEAPLDPAVARVQERMRRMMLIAGATLGIGILAVLVGIVYRISLIDAEAPAPVPIDAAIPTVSLAELGLPPDARIVSSALNGDSLALTYSAGDEVTVIVFHLPTMAVINRLRVTGD